MVERGPAKEHEEVPARFGGSEQFELFCNPVDPDSAYYESERVGP